MNKIDFAFLDSGTGGIPYMLYLRQKFPNCNCVYLGDTANFPYGEKSPKEITECAASSIDLILKKWNPKTIVIGCNTISVTALSELRKLFPFTPIVGTVPAIKLAASLTKNKRIGLLATNATVKHPYCQNLINNFASDCKVFSLADPSLISFVEKNLFNSSEDEKINAVLSDVNFFKKNDCDVIILGCTHFTHLAKEFSIAAGPKIKVVDSREGVAKQAIRVENSMVDFVVPASTSATSAEVLAKSASTLVKSAEVLAKSASTSATSAAVLANTASASAKSAALVANSASTSATSAALAANSAGASATSAEVLAKSASTSVTSAALEANTASTSVKSAALAANTAGASATSAGIAAKKVAASATLDGNAALSAEVLSLKSFTFFVTKANETEVQEYKTLCKNLNIPWGGVIS